MGEQLNFNLAKSWINTCIVGQGQHCSSPSLCADRPGPKRLIDVMERKLIPTSVEHPLVYAALSYTWGQSVQLTLGKDTYDRLTTSGGLSSSWNDIPTTIKDAMVLCGELGIMYLWVDALCIQQDDHVERENQISTLR